MTRLLPLLAVLVPLTAPAQDLAPLDAAGFDARTQGKTITYSAGGVPYGTEQYLPGHRVIWAFTAEDCRAGTWFQQGEEICFDYGDESGLQCWQFFDTPAGLSARFAGSPESDPLVSLAETAEPLACPGPKIGA